MMRPKAKEGNGQEDGLLEYLEEIIGSNRHVPAITAAAQEVHTHLPSPPLMTNSGRLGWVCVIDFSYLAFALMIHSGGPAERVQGRAAQPRQGTLHFTNA
jgi:hypothetical protein